MRISDEELDELLKKKTPKEIINLHCNLKINLKSKQLDKVLKLKRERGQE